MKDLAMHPPPTAADIVALMRRVRAEVESRHGVRLHPQIHVDGPASVPDSVRLVGVVQIDRLLAKRRLVLHPVQQVVDVERLREHVAPDPVVAA